jgi:hypothetical protein
MLFRRSYGRRVSFSLCLVSTLVRVFFIVREYDFNSQQQDNTKHTALLLRRTWFLPSTHLIWNCDIHTIELIIAAHYANAVKCW